MAEPQPQSQSQGTKVQIPSDFKKIIVDMTKDILVSFPEQKNNMNVNLHNLIFEDDVDKLDYSLKYVFTFCKTVYPKRFFDILYQTVDVFSEDIEFLPGINFKLLWNENISDKTRETIWKYLQLVLFNIVSSISDGNTFGDTAKLFETINQDEFKSKLEETINQMQTLFGENNTDPPEDADNNDGESDTNSDKSSKKGEKTSGINLEDLPNPADIQNHVNNMMNSNLGKLAREIAEETASELNIDMENATSINDVFKNLMSNPSKIMGLVKNVGSKLDAKMKSGDVKESDLLAEASEMMKKMKDMPGMGDIQSMMSKMGMNPQGKGPGKVNVNAMQNNLDKKLREAKNRERILRNLAEKKAAAAAAEEAEKSLLTAKDDPCETIVFSKGEHVERSTREQMTTIENHNTDKKKKKKKSNK
jgi:hypothetical protein